MTIIDIRKATQKDALTLSFLHEQITPSGWGEQAFRALFLQSNIYIWLAYIDKKPVGLLACRAVIDEAEILTIGVHSDYQRNGVAQSLMVEAETILYENNIHNIYLEVRANNLPAKSLYIALDYHKTGIRKDYYNTVQGRVDGIMMKKTLQ